LEYGEILSKFEIYKSSGNQAKCICPSHNDKQASLSVCYNPSAKRTLIYCQAGCETGDVLKKVNLSAADLYDKQLEEEPTNLIKDDLKNINSTFNSKGEIDRDDISLNKELFKLLKEQLKEQNLIIHELSQRLKQEQNINQNYQALLNEKPGEKSELEEHFIDLDAKLANIRVKMEDKEVTEYNTPKFFKRIFRNENNESSYKYKK